MAYIAKITAVRPVCILNDARRRAVIPRSQRWELLGQRIHRISLISAGIVGIAGKASVIISQKKVHASFSRFSIIQMQQETISVNLHLVCCILCMQSNRLLLLVIYYAHNLSLLICYFRERPRYSIFQFYSLEKMGR